MVKDMDTLGSDMLHFNIAADQLILDGTLTLPTMAEHVLIFVQGSSGNRLSLRNRALARRLNHAGFATLLVDLLTLEEQNQLAVGDKPQQPTFDCLTRRLLVATDRINTWPETSGMSLGYFAIGGGVQAALQAAAEQPWPLGAIVAWGGQPELASTYLTAVRAPTLMIVNDDEQTLITRNQAALPFLPSGSSLALISSATHLNEPSNQIDAVVRLSVRWFERFLK